MKIEGTNPLRSRAVSPAKTGRPAKGDGFAEAMEDSEVAAGTSAGVTGTSPIGSVDSLLALQGSDDVGERHGRARARGEALLDRLDMLRTDILSGRVPRGRLDELSALVRSSRAEVDDPRLVEVLDEIELRAEVELAKLAADR